MQIILIELYSRMHRKFYEKEFLVFYHICIRYALFIRSDGAIITTWWYLNIFNYDVWSASFFSVLYVTCSIIIVQRVKRLTCSDKEHCDDEFSSPFFNMLYVLGSMSGQGKLVLFILENIREYFQYKGEPRTLNRIYIYYIFNIKEPSTEGTTKQIGEGCTHYLGLQKVPRDLSMRIIMLSLLMMGMLLSYGFSSTLTSCLASKGNSVAVTDLEDVAVKRTHSLCVRNNSGAYRYFTVVKSTFFLYVKLRIKKRNP